MALNAVTARQARRVLMLLQGLADDPQQRIGPSSLARLIDRLGFLQLDSIRVIERAHHLTLHTRRTSYRPDHLQTLIARGDLFEHWTHDASVIPVRWLPHWRHRFRRDRTRIADNAWWAGRIGPDPQSICRAVKGRIRREGPLRSADFSRRESQAGGWWRWKPAKAALEYLWRSGDLAVCRRDGRSFQKYYDLAARVYPPVRMSSVSNHLDWACGEALDRLGTATPAELAAFFRAVPLNEARTWCARGLQRGTLIEVNVERLDAASPRRCVARPDLARLVRRADRAELLEPGGPLRLLCPFDPVIRDRARLKRLFKADYRLGAFTPAAKRTRGYYAMPILDGDRIIGRVDLKADRPADVLCIRGLWWEPGHRPRRRKLDAPLARLARFAGVSRVR